MRRLHLALLCLVSVGLCLVEKNADALNVQLLRPSAGHVQGYQLFTSEALPKNHLTFGLNLNYVQNPFEQIIGGTTTRTAGVIDRFVTADFLASYAFTDWLSLNVDMPLNLYHDVAPTLIPSRDQGGGDAGDLGANFKITVWDAGKTESHLGLAFVPFVTLPTGRESIFFGDASVTGGAMVVGDAQWKSNRFYLNLGSRFREREQLANLVVHHEFLFGAGLQRPIVKKWNFDVIAEVFGSTTYDHFMTENISSPLEGIVVLRKKWLENRNLVTHIGGGAGFTNGYGAPDYRVIAGVSYAWDLSRKEPREEVIRTNKIHFEFDRAVIKPASYPVLDNIVSILKHRTDVEAIRIEGHTDSRGSDRYNETLSDRRAAAVMDYLVSHGVSKSVLTSVGRGESEPIAPNEINGRDNPEGRAENRRVEFHLSIRPGTKLKVIEEGNAPTFPENRT